MPPSPSVSIFSEALPTLFEQIFAPESTYLACVSSVVEALRNATGWDRALYSEIRRVPSFSEVVCVSEAPGLSRSLLPSDIALPDFSVVSFVERSSGHLEVSRDGFQTATPLSVVPDELRNVVCYIQGFLADQGIQRGTYYPRLLAPNFSTMLSLHRCTSDESLSPKDLEALKLAHIVLKEIVQRKRWRFRIPGHSSNHDRVMAMLAAGWDIARIAATLAIPADEVRAIRNHIMIELENQYGIRSLEAAVVFLRGELAKPV